MKKSIQNLWSHCIDDTQVVDTNRPTPMRKAFSLVEVIIVFFLLVVLVGSLSFGFISYSQRSTIKNTQERIERLLSQADFFSTVLQQDVEVSLTKKDAHWYAELNLWGEEGCKVFDIFNNLPQNFVDLAGIESILFNGTEYTNLLLVFRPMIGIDVSYVYAKDWTDIPLSATKLGLDSKNLPPHSLKLEIKDKEKTGSIDLLPFVRIMPHTPIPQEYIDLES